MTNTYLHMINRLLCKFLTNKSEGKFYPILLYKLKASIQLIKKHNNLLIHEFKCFHGYYHITGLDFVHSPTNLN